jgi:DNA-binding transcriptional MerR regulator
VSVVLPEKYFYTIGDVCKMTSTKAHVLRYWESQFKLLRPARRYSGHRKYTKREIDLINRIRQLVVDKQYTLAGAKKEINRVFSPRPQATTATGPKTVSTVSMLQEIKYELEACLRIMEPRAKQELFDLK